MSSCFVFIIPILLSHFFSQALCTGMISSHSPLALFIFAAVLGNHFADSDTNAYGGSQPLDYVEDLGGAGPRVAVYLRQSKKKAGSFSIEAQRDAMNEMKDKYKPSRIYWFVDQRSSKSARDFDKLKINWILELRERKEVEELWIFLIDRMGRVFRKLVYFFLEFCDDGGIIRTPERAYGMEDLLDFVREADQSQKANEVRVKAVVSAKARGFRQKRWNKRAVPLGYTRKDHWLEKLPGFEQLIIEIYSLFLTTKNLRYVSKRLGTFGGLLAKALNPDRVRRVVSDPVYIGKPEHMGAVVIDPNLAFIDEETFRKSREILTKIQERYRPKRIGPLESLAISKPITFLQILEFFELHHRGCGGLVVKNGTTNDEGLWQQLFKCNKCRDFWRLPPIKCGAYKGCGAAGKDSMGGLNFDNSARLPLDKHIPRKASYESSTPKKKMLQKSENPLFKSNETNAPDSFKNETYKKVVKIDESLSPKKSEVHPKQEPHPTPNDLVNNSLKKTPEMDETRLQRAVQLSISAEYQLKREAFDFLKQIGATKDPAKLMEEAIRRLENIEEKPFFIERRYLEQIFFEEH